MRRGGRGCECGGGGGGGGGEERGRGREDTTAEMRYQ